MLAGHDSEDAGISDFEALVTYLVRLGGEVEAPEPARFRPR